MGANGSKAAGLLEREEDRRYRTMFTIGDNIKVLQPKSDKYGKGKLPEESHTPNRIYATFHADGSSLKAYAVYDEHCKKSYEVHLDDHKGLGPHYHPWTEGHPAGKKQVYRITPAMQSMIEQILKFKLDSNG